MMTTPRSRSRSSSLDAQRLRCSGSSQRRGSCSVLCSCLRLRTGRRLVSAAAPRLVPSGYALTVVKGQPTIGVLHLGYYTL